MKVKRRRKHRGEDLNIVAQAVQVAKQVCVDERGRMVLKWK
jgi:hypothetical protein